MKCPSCGNKNRVEINLHADGFAPNLHECGNCGALWSHKGDGAILIVGPDVNGADQ